MPTGVLIFAFLWLTFAVWCVGMMGWFDGLVVALFAVPFVLGGIALGGP